MAAVATDVALLFLDKLSRELGLPKHGRTLLGSTGSAALHI